MQKWLLKEIPDDITVLSTKTKVKMFSMILLSVSQLLNVSKHINEWIFFSFSCKKKPNYIQHHKVISNLSKS